MNRLLIIACALLLSSCARDDIETNDAGVPNPELVTGINMPEGLKDCKTFHVYGEKGFHMLVTRCPHSDVATAYGKNGRTVVAEDEETPEPTQ